MPVEADVSAVVLAGGRGTRMGGADKGLLEYRQRPLIEWVLEAVRPQVNEVIINANRNLDIYAAYACRLVPDTLPDYPGPLAGVLAAMDVVGTEWLLVVPCDTPHLPADLVQCLRHAAQTGGVPIAIAADASQAHYAIMLVQTSLADSLRRYLKSGARAIHRWQGPFNPTRYTFAAGGFENLNTLADLRTSD